MGLSKTVDCPRAYTYSNVSFCIRYSKRFRKRFRKRLCAKTHNERPILKIMNNVLIWGFLNLIRYEECPLYVNKIRLEPVEQCKPTFVQLYVFVAKKWARPN